MALVKGTNCGFVSVAPTADPQGTATTASGYATAIPDTSPATAVKVTEIGWWCDNATEEANYEVGIYTDSTLGYPANVVGSLNQTNAKGTTAGWKRVTGLNIAISGSVVYWIAMQCDSPTTPTNTDYDTLGGTGRSTHLASFLPDPWTNTATGATYRTFYAVWEAAASGTNTQINIGDSWKAVSSMQINIGDSWKAVSAAKINIGDSWKTIF